MRLTGSASRPRPHGQAHGAHMIGHRSYPGSSVLRTGKLRFFFGALILLIAGASASASAIGLYVEELNDPNAVVCPYCHKPIIAGSIHENAVTTLTTEFGGDLAEKGIAITYEKGQPRYLHVLVYRFQERQGGNFSVAKPASVGFHTHVYEENDLVRTFVFDETQQPLSDNVFRFFTFLRRGGKWITAAELGREGVHKAVDAFAESLGEGGPAK
jgi:hypothetical protein